MSGERNPFGRILLPRRALPHQVDILHTRDIIDDAGGRIPVQDMVASRVPCWVQDLSLTEQIEFVRLDVTYSVKVIFFQNPGTLANDDVIRFGRRLLRVKTIMNELNINQVWTVMCDER